MLLQLLACIVFASLGDAQPIPTQPFPIWTQLAVRKIDKISGVDGSFGADFDLIMLVPTDVPIAQLNGSEWIDDVGKVASLLTYDYGYDFDNSNDYEVVSSTETLTAGRIPWLYVDPPDKLPAEARKLPANPEMIWRYNQAPWYQNQTAYFFRWQRIKAVFDAEMPLQDFPFDKQQLSIQVRMRLPYYFYTMIPNPTANFMNDTKGMSEWKRVGISTHHSLYQLAGFPDQFSLLNFNINIERIPTYYYLKIISGITMVVIMNWMLFGLDMGDSNRIAVAATLFLAIIAYLFIVANDVPKVAYATRLDNFILISLANVFLACMLFTVEHLIDKQVEQRVAADDDNQKVKRQLRTPPTHHHTHGVAPVNPIKYMEQEGDVLVVEVPADSEPIADSIGAEKPATAPSWHHRWATKRRKVDAICLAVCVVTFSFGAPWVLWA